MDDFYSAMMAGSQPQQDDDEASGEIPEELRGSQSGLAGGAGGDLLGELLQGLMSGGGAGVQDAPGAQMPLGGGLMGLLGGLLGGGGAGQIGGAPNLMPFTEALSEKLGISSQVASALIGVAFTLLTGMLQKSSQQGRSGAVGMDLDTMLDEEFLASSGMASQIAEQTGLDDKTAAHHLREAMVMLASEYPGEASAGP